MPSPDETAAEDRFVQRINAAIEAGTLKRSSAWTKSSKDVKVREKRKQRADAEAIEAEKAAQELGVHDKLYGGAGKKGKGKKGATAAGGTEADLQALIRQRQAGRMEALIGSLEAKYGDGEDEEDEPPAKKVRAVAGVDHADHAAQGQGRRRQEAHDRAVGRGCVHSVCSPAELCRVRADSSGDGRASQWR